MKTIIVNNNQLINDARGISRYYYSLEQFLKRDFFVKMLFDKPAEKPLRRVLRAQFPPLRELDYDLLWSISHTGPIVAKKHIVTVHDVIPLHPESGVSKLYRFYYKNNLKLLLAHSMHIVCISASVADLVQVYFKIRSEKISLIRNGYNLLKPINEQVDSANLPTLPESYFLFVGTLSIHKNLQRLVEGFKHFRRENDEFKLVIAGHFPNTLSLGRLSIDFNTLRSQGVMFVNDPSDSLLDVLYKNCNGLVMPSLAEGFGLPLSEALSYGKPIICSDIAVFRELFSGIVRCFFDPYDIESISKSIELLAKTGPSLNKSELENYSSKSAHTWSSAATEYVTLFNKLLQ
jgi:glycosyltransferase involved in cell wall biosynthesis